MPPKIGPIASLKIKAGQLINFEVNIEGEPPATVTWFDPNMVQLLNGGKIKLENVDYKTKLQIRGTERENDGIYTIKAVNENGEDTATVKVTILGKK